MFDKIRYFFLHLLDKWKQRRFKWNVLKYKDCFWSVDSVDAYLHDLDVLLNMPKLSDELREKVTKRKQKFLADYDRYVSQHTYCPRMVVMEHSILLEYYRLKAIGCVEE